MNKLFAICLILAPVFASATESRAPWGILDSAIRVVVAQCSTDSESNTGQLCRHIRQAIENKLPSEIWSEDVELAMDSVTGELKQSCSKRETSDICGELRLKVESLLDK